MPTLSYASKVRAIRGSQIARFMTPCAVLDLAEIGELFGGMSGERIRQIQNGALAKLAKKLSRERAAFWDGTLGKE